MKRMTSGSAVIAAYGAQVVVAPRPHDQALGGEGRDVHPGSLG